MGHPLSSESGKSIQEWILYHAIRDPVDFWLCWDPTDPYDIKLLQEYVGSNKCCISPKQHNQESHQPLELYESTHQEGKIC